MQDAQVIRTEEGRTVVVPGRSSMSRQEFHGLELRRNELQSQIRELRSRRNDLEEQYHRSQGPAREAAQARLNALDARRVTLENQLDRINEQIANAPMTAMMPTVTTTGATQGSPFERAIARELVPVTAIVSIFVLLPLALAFARLMWKRATAIGTRPVLNEQALVNRLEQLQTSVDTMAVEIERISEGQRYLTKASAVDKERPVPR